MSHMSHVIFETARLVARRLEPHDVDALFAVYGDAGAMRWVGDGRPITRAQCVAWLAVTENNYRVRGYGMFALAGRDDGRVVGFCGLVHPGGQTEAEIKYALERRHWGRGLATEAVVGMLAYAAKALGLARVIATTAPENAASHRVLLKAGMKPEALRCDDDGAWSQDFGWTPPPG